MTAATNPRRFEVFDALVVGLVAIQIALAFHIARNGPLGPIPVHFGIDGAPNGWGDRTEVAWMLGGLATLTLLANLTLALLLGRKLLGGAALRTAMIGRGVAIAIPSAVTVIFAALALAPDANGGLGGQRLIWTVTWLMLIGLGAVMGKLPPNLWGGVRVYWTFHSRLAWDKANRLLARIIFLGAILGLLATPFVERGQTTALMIGWLVVVVGGGSVLAIFESWRVWRTDPERTA